MQMSKCARPMTKAECVVKNYQILPFVLFTLIALNAHAEAEEPGKLFQTKCASCHTVGKGQLVGPDLVTVKNWESDKLSAAVSRMQSMAGPLSQEEIDTLTNFLKTSNSPEADPISAVDQKKDVSSSDSDKLDDTESKTGSLENIQGEETSSDGKVRQALIGTLEEGEKLFTGQKAFVNGGMSCLACHSSSDGHGALGPSLTKIGDKMNEAALVTACRLTPYKVMKAAYEKHPIIDQEAADLAKYLVSTKSKIRAESQPFVPYGFAGALVLVLSIAIGYHKRNSGVHSKLHRR